MKKFINSPDKVVEDSINGLIRSNDLLCSHPNNRRVVLRNDLKRLKEDKVVTLISGGGSGHEPFAAGFVGKNALTGAVCGDIFASPPTTAVMDAVNAVSGDAGTIVFVINYTGDRLNFGIATERVKVQTSNRIALLYVDDDVALEHKAIVATGGRGLAGVCLLIHIIGTFAEQNKMSFEELTNTSRLIIDNIATFGVNLEPCALPGQGKMFELSNDEYELGLGIHGESGIERKKMQPAKEICPEILERIVRCNRLYLKKDDPIVILLNNLGSVSQLEMGILKNELINWLKNNGYNVQCLISGTLMTSIDARGFSITILRIIDQKWLQCLLNDKSAVSSLWTASKINKDFNKKIEQFTKLSLDHSNSDLKLGPEISQDYQNRIKCCLEDACRSLMAMESELNRLDSSVGDGDCGTSMRTAANSILKSIEKGELAFSHPKQLFQQLSKLFETAIGGTSGALYALMMNAASGAFDKPLSSNVLKNALKLALDNVMYYGGAKPGSRTMLDPLEIAANYHGENWKDIIKAVEERAKETTTMEAKAGRASYTEKSRQQEPDPGAMAFAIWFRAVFDRYEKFCKLKTF